MSASDGTRFECEGVAPSGKQRPGEGEPISRKKFAAFAPIIIAFVFSAGVGFFVVGPFVATQTMGNPGMAARAHGDNLHHKAAFMPMQLTSQAAQPSLRVSEFPARMSSVAMGEPGKGPYEAIWLFRSRRAGELMAELKKKPEELSEEEGQSMEKKIDEEWEALSAEAKKPFEDEVAAANKKYIQ